MSYCDVQDNVLVLLVNQVLHFEVILKIVEVFVYHFCLLKENAQSSKFKVLER